MKIKREDVLKEVEEFTKDLEECNSFAIILVKENSIGHSECNMIDCSPGALFRVLETIKFKSLSKLVKREQEMEQEIGQEKDEQ